MPRHLIRRAFAFLFPALLAAAPATRPTTRPAAPPSRNAVRPTPPPFMLGVNLCGAEFGEKFLPGVYDKHFTYPTGKELDYYNSKGLRLIRLPFRWERLQPTLLGELDPTELGRIDRFVAEVRRRDMRIIPEPHNFARYRDKLIGTPEVPNSAFADFWRRLASHFKDEPSIWAYGLVNEPHDTKGLWPAAAQAAADAIREVDAVHHILVPGDGWSGAADWRKNNENLWVTDPRNKIVYEAHLYFDRDKSGTYKKPWEDERATLTIGLDRLKPFRDWLDERNAVGFVGEFGVPGGADRDERWITALDNFVRHLRENQMPACYWAGGPWWGNYPLSIEPRNGQDRPQMKAFTTATGANRGGTGKP